MNKYDKQQCENINWGLFEDSTDTLWVPKSIREALLQKEVGKKTIKSIYNYDLTMDRVMWFLSILNHKLDDYKQLSSEILRNFMGEKYKAIINLLRYKQPISNYKPSSSDMEWLISCDDYYATPTLGHQESKSLGYKLLNRTEHKGNYVQYQLKTDTMKELLNQNLTEMKRLALENTIARNQVILLGSGRITLPTIAEVKKRAVEMHQEFKYFSVENEKKKLVNGDKPKKFKGLYCVYLEYNKKRKNDYGVVPSTPRKKKAKRVRFLDDNIKLYNSLFYANPLNQDEKKFKIPKQSTKKMKKQVTCERVFDSISMMPSWIRAMIKIDGKLIVENDYSSLHPHFMMKILGKTEYDQIATSDIHQLIADEVGLDRGDVKTIHLAFFNREIYQIMEKEMVLFIPEEDRIEVNEEFPWKETPRHKIIRYYLTNFPMMMYRMLSDKTEINYKFTSGMLLKKEVELMTEVIEELNRRDIYVLYVYDALYSSEEDTEEVRCVMNEIASKHGLKTTAG